MAQQLFGLVPAGLPVFTTPTETPSPTSFIYTIPTAKPFSHIVIFLLPGVVLPDNTAAAIYLVTPPPPGQPTPAFKFLGGVGPGKESAIFKLNAAAESSGQVVLGISVEEAGSVAQRIEELAQAKSAGAGADGVALVPASASAQQRQAPSTLVLAQRIIKNAFNFLSGFSGQAGQVEVVPLKAFEEWWRKFESKVRTDPGFLERDDS
ncbi:putative duf775 domain-containing protein [Phaeoacremonium minimum UCRPA7]|uniref:Putative duf775 domain-containing protein n=1 Tax=Phaeoacremonium minimum (strain UCR-PA7) TaxID=1286976 RepID=R8BX04_PHAM7|nr:putative duf775 domain-containing protein [Phaeoacremonium minimum UCRPA7]EOO03888.1 putative duf775 domain-containing protein [Phaeoacremonium minimum UCRPA7]